MRIFISLYFLIQSLIVSIFLVRIYHSFIEGFDTLLLIIDLLVIIVSLWILIRKRYNIILCFAIYLTYSILVGLFEIPLLVIGNGALLLFIICIAKFVTNIYLSYKIMLTSAWSKPWKFDTTYNSQGLALVIIFWVDYFEV